MFVYFYKFNYLQENNVPADRKNSFFSWWFFLLEKDDLEFFKDRDVSLVRWWLVDAYRKHLIITTAALCAVKKLHRDTKNLGNCQKMPMSYILFKIHFKNRRHSWVKYHIRAYRTPFLNTTPSWIECHFFAKNYTRTLI